MELFLLCSPSAIVRSEGLRGPPLTAGPVDPLPGELPVQSTVIIQLRGVLCPPSTGATTQGRLVGTCQWF